MKYNLYSIYDEILNVYNNPYPSINDQDAQRQLKMASNDPDTQLHQSPQDFSLYHVGTYDDELGEYTNIFPKQLIIRVSQLIIKNEA